jgi:selenocysteine lyase/cysteine desulfurase
MLEATGAAAFFPAALASLEQFSSALASTPQGESYWEQVRRQFPFREERVPMNAANLCPSPRVVAERVTQWTYDIDVDCSFNNRHKFTELLETSRRKVAEHLGVTADEIALVRNTSEANNTINNGLPLAAGDEIVLWDQNHPTNNVAWDVRALRYGLAVKRVTTPTRPAGPDQLVKVFEEAFTPKTRVLAITHVSNASGVRLPVPELCDAAHPRGIYVHVDGAQTWGALSVDLRQLKCDSYTASAHKWLVGPKEVGLLYVHHDRIAEIWPNIVAPGWGDDAEPDVRGARKFESLGQRDDAALAAISEAVDFHRAIEPRRIEERIGQLASRLKGSLHEAGINLVTPLDPTLSAGVCVIDVPPAHSNEVFNRLYQQHGIAGSTTGGLRLCPHIYNTFEHIDRAVRGILSMRALVAS